MIEKIEIPLSKKKIIFLLGGGVILIAGGIWLAANPENFIPNLFRITDPDFIRFWGIAGIVFFGLALIFGIKKLFDKRSGLIIDQEGITDNSNASSIGLIKWADITDIRTEQVMSTKFFLIDVKNPEYYIENSNSRLKMKLLRANMSSYGTPLSITLSTLDYDFHRLEKLIKESREKTCGNNV
ncbi:STM3941 family protein [Salinimicrobium sp. TH3]|uniref:STM3941 family protein n=1 Tax=Salinimicrobium sp. TH3 TaxID=2997342 RepID=UPI0022731760|nr:STM3941 family protein [Salinimicrobium sp. TH3]MCY2686784.1 hypothetical protein [Salinimicrobium sp. TH3]